MPFFSLGLMPPLVQAAGEVGYSSPTPIQQTAIPAVLNGQDVLGLAQTGSGKTAAFALPLLQRWAQAPRQRPHRAVHTLVLVPTRELATQVAETLRLLALRLPERPKITVLIGGGSLNPQRMALRGGTDIVVATPGRLLDLLSHNALRLDAVQALVLDEADRLLDLGFTEELQRVLAALPPARQNLCFSATFGAEVEALATRLLRQPLRLEVESTAATTPDITQRAIEVDARRRTQLLRHLLAQQAWPRVLVFVATQHATEVVAEKLRRAGLTAEPFHGTLSQGKRDQVVSDFKAGRLQVVVATDLAARGLDIAQLPVVVNYDLPRSANDHLHRIGRTGRAGATGLAVSFIPAGSEAHFRLIEKRQGQRVARERVPGFEPVQEAAPGPEPAGGGGVKGRRPNKKDKARAAAASSLGKTPAR